MMQETGNNIQVEHKILSIRLTPGGLYFSLRASTKSIQRVWEKLDLTDNLNGDVIEGFILNRYQISCADFEAVRLELCSPRTVLVPDELFSDDLATTYLSTNGYIMPSNEELVVTRPTEGVVCVQACRIGILPIVNKLFGERMKVVSPFDKMMSKPTNGSVWIDMHDGFSYVTVFDEKLVMADCLPLQTFADVLYFAHKAEKLLKNKCTYIISGKDVCHVASSLRKYYKRVLELN